MKSRVVNKFKWLILSALALISVVIFCGCSPALIAPSQLVVDKTTLMLSWTPIENATAYIVEIDSREYASSESSFSLGFLESGEHTIRVKARDANSNYRDSSWSQSVTFTKEYESGMVYTLINANTEYEITRVGTARGDIVIDDVYRDKPVTRIAARAFYSSGSVTSITIGQNIKTIGDYAFINCSNLTSITFNNDITDIGVSAFQGCRGLTSVTLPASLTNIDKSVFKYCRYLESITLGDSIESIGEEAFNDCDKLTSIDIPNSVKSIGKSAFLSCDALQSVKLGGVEQIGEAAFSGCKSLTSIIGGNDLVTIGTSAFANCPLLTSFTVGNKTETIGTKAFSGCSALVDITISDSVSEIGQNAFADTALYANNVTNGIIYADKWMIGYTDDYADKSLDSTVIKSGVYGVANYAFAGNGLISSVTLPDSVKYIGDYAFANCTDLVSFVTGDGAVRLGRYALLNDKYLGRGKVSIGSSVKEIASYAFYNCSDLRNPAYESKDFKIPLNVETVGTYAFRNTYEWNNTSSGVVTVGNWVVGYIDNEEDPVPNVEIGRGIVGISNYAFYKSKVLETVYISETVSKMGTSVFQECAKLTFVEFSPLNEDLNRINDYMFYKCAELREVEIPQSVDIIGRSAFYKSGVKRVNFSKWLTDIGDYAYYGCDELLEVNFENDSRIATIGNYAFANCSALPEIAIPDSVTEIGDRAFSKCSALADIKLGSGVKTIGAYAFNACVGLTEIVLPDSLVTLSEKAFYKCTGLESVKFGNSLAEIGDYAFYGCTAITGIDIPASVKTIGNYAFRNCRGLTSVVLRSTIDSIGEHAFNGCRYLTLYVEDADTESKWSPRWNSGYRPVVYNCTFAADGDYVVSFVKTENGLQNLNATNGVVAPTREGYAFVGWKAVIKGTEETEEQERIYALDEIELIKELEDGTVLTAVWAEDVQE